MEKVVKKMVGVQAWVEDVIQETIASMAQKDDISISSWVRRAIKEKIERDLPSRPQ